MVLVRDNAPMRAFSYVPYRILPRQRADSVGEKLTPFVVVYILDTHISTVDYFQTILNGNLLLFIFIYDITHSGTPCKYPMETSRGSPAHNNLAMAFGLQLPSMYEYSRLLSNYSQW